MHALVMQVIAELDEVTRDVAGPGGYTDCLKIKSAVSLCASLFSTHR